MLSNVLEIFKSKLTNRRSTLIRTDEQWMKQYAQIQKGHQPLAKDAIWASHLEAKEFVSTRIIFEGAKVMDLGCGNGRQAIGLEKYNIGEYKGVEIIKECVDFCNEIFAEMENFECVWLNVFNEFYNKDGDVAPSEMQLPFPDEYFDSVIAGSLFTHLGNYDICSHYISEVWRVLKPQGRFASTWFRSPPNELSDDRGRTVLREGDILKMVTEKFHIFYSRTGTSKGFHDQWCLHSEKQISMARPGKRHSPGFKEGGQPNP